jgi:hypothetical protein
VQASSDDLMQTINSMDGQRIRVAEAELQRRHIRATEAAAESADRTSAILIWLTVALVVLTAALLFLTVVLIFKA